MAPTVFATTEKIGSLLDQSITRHYLTTVTDCGGKVCAEYVWIGGTMMDLRSKSRTLDKVPATVEVRGEHTSGRREERRREGQREGVFGWQACVQQQ